MDAFRRALAGAGRDTLLLGVTPELAFDDRRISAIDRSPGMISRLWPGNTPDRDARTGDWLSLPFDDARFDCAIGDGSLNMVAFPDGQERLYAELRRVLRRDGRIVFRLFETPEDCETPDALFAAAEAGRIESFHAFKFRIAMSLAAGRGDANVPVDLIRETFVARCADRALLSARTGWPSEDIDTIDVYRGSSDVYAFPTQAEFESVVPEDFSASRETSGDYELAERCPMLIVRRR